MKRFFLTLPFAVVTFALAATANAQDWAKARLNNSPRHREYVDIHSGDRTIKAFIVYPEAKEKTPVVLVVHEIFGLTDWVKSLCDQLAENGVIAICPDLLSGQAFPDDVDAAVKAISALPKPQVKADLDATANYALTKIPSANGKLAICGFCWGGGWAFGYANENAQLKAAYSFYGTAPDTEENVKNIPCPVFGFYAEKDERVDATIPKAKELMKAAGKKYEPVVYSGAGHGFMRAGEMPNPDLANAKARDDAWARWKKLLTELK
jgi:carboxymethylenebutenolidase